MKTTYTAFWRLFKTRHSLSLSVAFLFLVLPGTFFAQVVDTLPPVPAKKEKFLPKPGRALLYALVPGGGQIYNRKYWKVPIVYGIVGGLYLLSVDNRSEYVKFRDAYQNSLAGEPHPFGNEPPAVLRNNRDIWRKSLEESYIFLGLAYLAQMAEAYVDAHLQDFDISDDLSMRIKPAMTPTPMGPSFGLSLRLQRPTSKASP